MIPSYAPWFNKDRRLSKGLKEGRHVVSVLQFGASNIFLFLGSLHHLQFSNQMTSRHKNSARIVINLKYFQTAIYRGEKIWRQTMDISIHTYTMQHSWLMVMIGYWAWIDDKSILLPRLELRLGSSLTCSTWLPWKLINLSWKKIYIYYHRKSLIMPKNWKS